MRSCFVLARRQRAPRIGILGYTVARLLFRNPSMALSMHTTDAR